MKKFRMLKNKPALPDHIHPKDVALRLFFRDFLVYGKFNEIVEYEELVTHEELYNQNGVFIVCGSLAGIDVKISYIDGFLNVKTAGAVDVYLSGSIPAKAIQVETMGDCLFFNGKFLSPNLNIYVESRVIVFGIPIKYAGLIILLPGDKIKSSVIMRECLTTVGLIINTTELILYSKLQADKTFITCKQIITSKFSELVVTGQLYDSIGYTDLFERNNIEQIKIINEFGPSVINIYDDLIYDGDLNLHKTKVLCGGKVKFILSQRVNLSQIEITAKSVDIDSESTILGDNTTLKLSENIKVDGNVSINNLSISAENIEISQNGVLDGISRLVVTPKKYLTVYGRLSSLDTTIDGNFTVAMFGGVVNGTNTLNIFGKFYAEPFSGCFSEDRTLNMAGINISLLGVVNNFSASFDSFVRSGFIDLYLPSVNFYDNPEELYNAACLNLNKLEELSSSMFASLYGELHVARLQLKLNRRVKVPQENYPFINNIEDANIPNPNDLPKSVFSSFFKAVIVSFVILLTVPLILLSSALSIGFGLAVLSVAKFLIPSFIRNAFIGALTPLAAKIFAPMMVLLFAARSNYFNAWNSYLNAKKSCDSIANAVQQGNNDLDGLNANQNDVQSINNLSIPTPVFDSYLLKVRENEFAEIPLYLGFGLVGAAAALASIPASGIVATSVVASAGKGVGEIAAEAMIHSYKYLMGIPNINMADALNDIKVERDQRRNIPTNTRGIRFANE